MSSEPSSSYMDDSELELGLGLSISGSGGGGEKFKTKSFAAAPAAAAGGQWDHQYSRILTARDFSSVASSSSSSSSVTKRTAEPSSPPCRSGVSIHVVGWPPIRTQRVNSLVNHTKSPATEEFQQDVDKCKSKKVVDYTDLGSNRSCSFVRQKRPPLKASFLVKVNMDGFPIGRKVDMNAHDCYETLARTIDNMFSFNAGVGSKVEEQARGPAGLLGGLSSFVLTYEDKDGDWMLVGDVPWEMFLSSVKRLRITRTADANGLAPKSHESKRRQLSTRI